MKNEYKFMIGNEFNYKNFKDKNTEPNPCVLLDYYGKPGQISNYYALFNFPKGKYKGLQDATKEDLKSLTLTGITLDCLITLAKKRKKVIGFIDNGFDNPAVYINDHIDMGCYECGTIGGFEIIVKDEKETDKQFNLRIAKKMGWVE